MKQIAVLMHEAHRGRTRTYLIDALATAWEKRGLRTRCIYGIREKADADLLISHVDLTRLPQDYAEYLCAAPRAVNRSVLDASKRRISTHLLCPDDDYAGPVIVKTDANSGGAQEAWLFKRRHPVLARLGRAAAAAMEHVPGQHFAWRKRLREYPVYGSLAEVPAGAFKNRALVVERFLPEREGDRYFIRHYLCLGDRFRSFRLVDSKPFVKRPSARLTDESIPVPDQVLILRRQLGLDYGKIDYTIHAGKVVIFDVNRTPALSATPAEVAHTAEFLADGIWPFLAK